MNELSNGLLFVILLLTFLGGMGFGAGIMAGVYAYRLLRTPERIERIKLTGSPDAPAPARMRPPPEAPEDRARKQMRAEAIERGAESLMQAALDNGRALTYEQAKARAAELIDALPQES